MLWLVRVVFSAIFLLSIVLFIPIAFDVGGRDAGLAYSLTLFIFYVAYSAIKIITPDTSRGRWALTQMIRLSQWIVIPGLLIWSLNRFSVDAGSTDWVAKTMGHFTTSGKTATWSEWLFGDRGLFASVTLGGWDKSLSYSSPIFQLLEGFCSLLVIQAIGQISRYLVNRGRSDTWVIIFLVVSASIIASALYFLWRVAQFPQLDNTDATLIGIVMTTALFLCAYGIGSGKGNPVESSLLFAYIVLCIYQIFTDYLPSKTAAETKASAQPEFPPLPPVIMASFSTLLHLMGNLPSAVSSAFAFLYAAFQTITPSVLISLTYRIIVFYGATRIIPAVRDSGARALMHEPELEDSDTASKLLGFLSWFSASILIAVYTSLLLQHFSVSKAGDNVGWTLREGDAGSNPWRWVNVVGTMFLYSIELYIGSDDTEMSNHWKMD